jgi:hypothetical protein
MGNKSSVAANVIVANLFARCGTSLLAQDADGVTLLTWDGDSVAAMIRREIERVPSPLADRLIDLAISLVESRRQDEAVICIEAAARLRRAN